MEEKELEKVKLLQERERQLKEGYEQLQHARSERETLEKKHQETIEKRSRRRNPHCRGSTMRSNNSRRRSSKKSKPPRKKRGRTKETSRRDRGEGTLETCESGKNPCSSRGGRKSKTFENQGRGGQSIAREEEKEMQNCSRKRKTRSQLLRDKETEAQSLLEEKKKVEERIQATWRNKRNWRS